MCGPYLHRKATPEDYLKPFHAVALPSEEIIAMVERLHGKQYTDHELILCVITWLDGREINAELGEKQAG